MNTYIYHKPNLYDIMTGDIEIIKVRRRLSGIQVTVPKSVSHILDNVKYVACTIDETGIHYSPVKE